MSAHTPGPRRVRTVEHEVGWGWIARNPDTGSEIWPGFRWASRSVARDVVREACAGLAKPQEGASHG